VTEASKRGGTCEAVAVSPEGVRNQRQLASVFSTEAASGTGNLAKITAHRRAQMPVAEGKSLLCCISGQRRVRNLEEFAARLSPR
jgi:hypothetical protein